MKNSRSALLPRHLPYFIQVLGLGWPKEYKKILCLGSKGRSSPIYKNKKEPKHFSKKQKEIWDYKKDLTLFFGVITTKPYI